MKGRNMTTATNTALAVLNNFGGSVPACSPELDLPQIWRLDQSGEWVEYPNHEHDIYTAIFQFSTRHQFSVGKPVGSAFVARTIGWGAPLQEDGTLGDIAPSEHPDRFRVALDICATPSGAIASRLSFLSGDKVGDIVDDTGQATGSLAEAVDLCAFRVWGREYTSALLMDYTAKADNMDEKELQHLAHRVARFLDVMDDEAMQDAQKIVADAFTRAIADDESESE
jgi:hypothetical protein